ncbi:hypothetical protein [Asticcacaulis sp. EMRT-3]|uniref:hypothetical protein n=1 Tax=Asticcacaulis sp. EMRT-3 TaxID=3040349 RepID=UPI0024AF26E1|nr:hypothetical protein [Asticcacaulis sp. EMRT-3]MDI7775905.1 hypothetical protein [Asticcacaulis sp. EMRT-3]
MTIELTWLHLDVIARWRNESIGMDIGEFPADIGYDAERIVYVIRLKRPCYVEYNNGRSPVCYIGSGRGWRIFTHREGWLAKLPLLLDDFKGYDIKLSKPRRKGPGNFDAYKVVEADMIRQFKARYGERPLFNRSLGSGDLKFEYAHSEDVFGLGSGPGYTVPIKSTQMRRSGLLA